MSSKYFQKTPFFGSRETVQHAMDFAIALNAGNGGDAITAASVMYNTMAHIANEYIGSIESTKVGKITILFSELQAKLNQANEHKAELIRELDNVRNLNDLLTTKVRNLEGSKVLLAEEHIQVVIVDNNELREKVEELTVKCIKLQEKVTLLNSEFDN